MLKKTTRSALEQLRNLGNALSEDEDYLCGRAEDSVLQSTHIAAVPDEQNLRCGDLSSAPDVSEDEAPHTQIYALPGLEAFLKIKALSAAPPAEVQPFQRKCFELPPTANAERPDIAKGKLPDLRPYKSSGGINNLWERMRQRRDQPSDPKARNADDIRRSPHQGDFKD